MSQYFTHTAPQETKRNITATPHAKKNTKILLILVASMMLQACQSISYNNRDTSNAIQQLDQALTHFTQAKQMNGPDRTDALLLSATQLIEKKAYDKGYQALNLIPHNLDANQMTQFTLLKTQLLLVQHKTKKASTLLSTITPESLSLDQKKYHLRLTANLACQQHHFHKSLSIESQLTPLLNNEQRSKQAHRIWQLLEKEPLPTPQTNNTSIQAWYSLLEIMGPTTPFTTQTLVQVQSWQHNHPNHLGNALLKAPRNTYVPASSKSICFTAPLNSDAPNGQAMQDGLLAAYYTIPQNQRPDITFVDGSLSTTELKAQLQNIQCDKVVGHIPNKHFNLWRENSPKATILTLNLHQLTPNAIQDTANAMVIQAKQLGAQRAVIIAPDNEADVSQEAEDKRSLARSIKSQWQHNHGLLLSELQFKAKTGHSGSVASLLEIKQANARQQQLEKTMRQKTTMTPRRRQDIDAFFLIASAQEARNFAPLLKYYYAESIPLLVTLTDTPRPALLRKDLDQAWVYESPWMTESKAKWQKLLNQTSSDQRNQISAETALGYDALLLAFSWEKLKHFPHFSLSGKTGTLTADSNAHLRRALTWSKITHGGFFTPESSL